MRVWVLSIQMWLSTRRISRSLPETIYLFCFHYFSNRTPFKNPFYGGTSLFSRHNNIYDYTISQIETAEKVLSLFEKEGLSELLSLNYS